MTVLAALLTPAILFITLMPSERKSVPEVSVDVDNAHLGVDPVDGVVVEPARSLLRSNHLEGRAHVVLPPRASQPEENAKARSASTVSLSPPSPPPPPVTKGDEPRQRNDGNGVHGATTASVNLPPKPEDCIRNPLHDIELDTSDYEFGCDDIEVIFPEDT